MFFYIIVFILYAYFYCTVHLSGFQEYALYKNRYHFYYVCPSENTVMCWSFQRWKTKCCRVFLAVYPIMHLTWEGVAMCFHVAYLFGWSRVHTPLLKFAGVLLQIVSRDDAQTLTQSTPLEFKHKRYSLLCALRFSEN